jgi:DNA anti-recombination protein RmuC
MAAFADRMKTFTGRLTSSIEDRTESLARVHQATTDLLDETREFLDDVAHEHAARADEVHAFLSTNRADRNEAVSAMRDGHREFLDGVAHEHGTRADEVQTFLSATRSDRNASVTAMRDGHLEALDAMRNELNHTLHEGGKARREAVDLMRDTFQTARRELSADLRDSAKAWREFAAGR